jgi:hypothetical protein
MKGLAAATGSLAELSAPSGFGAAVSARVRQTEQVKQISLLERLFGPLRAPAPVLRRGHAFAGVALLLVAVMLLAMMLHPAGLGSSKANQLLPSMVEPATGQPASYPIPLPGQLSSRQPGPAGRP